MEAAGEFSFLWREETTTKGEKGKKRDRSDAALPLSTSRPEKGRRKLGTKKDPRTRGNKTQKNNQSDVWDLLYGNLDEKSVAEHGGGSGGGGGFSASGKNHALADPSRYPYSAVGALFAYREEDPLTGEPRTAPQAPSAPRPGSLAALLGFLSGGLSGAGDGAAAVAAAPTLACTGALVSPRHVLTAASCVSRPSYDLTWTLAEAAAGSSMGLASTWGDFEFVANLYGECSRAGGTKVKSARVPKEWSDWVDAFVAAARSLNSSSGDISGNATAASFSLRGSLVDANWALLTLEEDAPGSPGFFALGPQPTAADAAAWVVKATEEKRKNGRLPPPPAARLPAPGANLSRVAYGGPDAMAASTPTFSNCPLLDEVAGAAAASSSSSSAAGDGGISDKKNNARNDKKKSSSSSSPSSSSSSSASSSSPSPSSSPALVVGCSMYMGTRGAPLWQTPPSRQERAAALAAASPASSKKQGGAKDAGCLLPSGGNVTLPPPFATNPSARSILGIQAASLDYWHAYHALDAAGAASHLRAVAPALSLSEQAAQGLATAVTPEVARRLREWMLEDGITAQKLAEGAGPARNRYGAVADPRPPLLGGAASAAAAASATDASSSSAAVPASPAPSSKDKKAQPSPSAPRKGPVPTIPNLDAADRGRRATRAPGASAVSIVASVAQPGGTTAAAATAAAAAAAAAAERASNNSAALFPAPAPSFLQQQQQDPPPPSFDWSFIDSCPLPLDTSSSSSSSSISRLPVRDAPADAEALATAGKAGIDDPPLFGRHVPIGTAQAATFPFSATGLLRGYRNATSAGDAAAAVAGASGNATAAVPLGGAPPLTPPHDLNCGAALVGPRHVLTAHHCVFNATGRRVRNPLSLVFYPVASAGCGGRGNQGATNWTRPARVVSLRALPAPQGCLEDLPSDASVSAEKAESEACAGLLSSDYALLELDSDIGDELGFFALGPAPRKGGGSSGGGGGKVNLPAVNSTLTALGFGAASPETGLKVPSLSACTVLPTDAVRLAQKAGGGRGTAAAASAPPVASAAAKKGGAGAAEVPSSPDALAAEAAAASGDGHILYTGCAVTPGDSGGPLWVVVPGAEKEKKKKKEPGKNGTADVGGDDEASSTSSSLPERRLVGVASTVQTVWAAVSRADPTGKSNWLDAWRDTFGTSDALQSSAVAIDEGVAKRLRGWMADDGVPEERLRGAGRAPPPRRGGSGGAASLAYSSSNASAPSPSPSPAPAPPQKPPAAAAAAIATASAAVGPHPAP